MTMLIILSIFWILFWLITKRADYLVSRGTFELVPHGKIVWLFWSIGTTTFLISYIFLNLFESENFSTDFSKLLWHI